MIIKKYVVNVILKKIIVSLILGKYKKMVLEIHVKYVMLII